MGCMRTVINSCVGVCGWGWGFGDHWADSMGVFLPYNCSFCRVVGRWGIVESMRYGLCGQWIVWLVSELSRVAGVIGEIAKGVGFWVCL